MVGQIEHRFEIPTLSDNPDGWGPMADDAQPPEEFKTVPYAPFNKNDRIGRAADWTGQGFKYGQGRYGDRDKGVLNAAFSFFSTDDEDSFQLVDSRPVPKPKYGPRKFYQNRFNNRRDDGKRDGKESGGGADRERQRRERQQQQKRGQWQNFYPDRQHRASLSSSVDIRPEWVVLEQIPMSLLTKLSFDAGEPKDIVTAGALEFYDKSFDRITCKVDRPLERFETRQFHKVTTSDDPIIRRLAEENAAQVFATEALVTTLMCSPRSVFSWDIVVQRVGDKLFFDQRDASFDLLTVNETAVVMEAVPEEGINCPASLSQEATFINQNFSQQVLVKNGEKFEFEEPNPFASGPNEDVASVAYRYRKWKLDDELSVVIRCELDCVMEVRGQRVFACVNALNEFDPKVQGVDWRQKLETQRGAVLATELKNNSNKLAKWTAQALLAGAELMKLGYVSRVSTKDNIHHSILSVQAYKPSDFASQIALSSTNMWGIFKSVIDLCMKLEEGKYLLVKDPNKPILRLYQVPADAFENDYVEEPLAEEDQAPPMADDEDEENEGEKKEDGKA